MRGVVFEALSAKGPANDASALRRQGDSKFVFTYPILGQLPVPVFNKSVHDILVSLHGLEDREGKVWSKLAAGAAQWGVGRSHCRRYRRFVGMVTTIVKKPDSGTMPVCTGTAVSRSYLAGGLWNHCDLLLQMTKGRKDMHERFKRDERP